METGVYLPGLFAGIGLAFGIGFMFFVFHVPWMLFKHMVGE
jgi:hypothetical protein